MLVFFPKDRIGYDSGLLYDGVSFVKTNMCPPSAFVFGSQKLSEVQKIYLKHPTAVFPPPRHLKPFLSLGIKRNIPWHEVMPSKLFKRCITSLANELHADLTSIDWNYYNKVFVSTQPMFQRLQPTKVDALLYKSLTMEVDNDVLKTFDPKTLEAPTYSRCDSRTGRLKVTKGPDILRLNKDYRRILCSRFGKDGKLLYVDYKSLEPRVVLAIASIKSEIPQDIYLDVLSNLNENSITREVIKTTVVSELYGAGRETIETELAKYTRNISNIIQTIIEYFGLDDLRKRLLDQFNTNEGKYILNHYGRPVSTIDAQPYMLLNYLVQSTAVDVAMLGFQNIINEINNSNLEDKVVPVFLLHDALILDVHKEQEPYVKSVLTKVGSENIYGFESTKFWLKVEEF